MEITFEQRQLAEEGANEIQHRLYSEPEAGKQLWAIANKFGLVESNIYRVFTRIVGDVILGFHTQDQVSALIANKLPQIQGLNKIALEADIKIFLYPLTEKQIKEELTPLKQIELATPASITQVPHQSLTSEISAAEKELASLQTVRTMSHDMSAIKPGSDVVYQSNQADILARYNIPQPEVVSPPAEPPRWDTDSAK